MAALICDAADLASFQPIGYFGDSLYLTQEGWLRSDDAVDARAVIPLGSNAGGTGLRLSVTAELPSGSDLWLSFGDPLANPESLRIFNVSGKWGALVGDQLRSFDDALPPPPPAGTTNVYSLEIEVDTSRGRFASAVRIDGQVTDAVPIPPSLWKDVPHPATWDSVAVSLRGGGTLRRVGFRMEPPNTLIIIR